MTLIKLTFYYIVLDFIGDMYGIFRVGKKAEQMQVKFNAINKLRGDIMLRIEEEAQGSKETK